jgi:hypothetical protein
VVLVCFTGASLTFLARRDWLTGIALGFLVLKPQFLVAIPLVLLLARAWRVFAGLAVSAGLQLASSFFYFGRGVMRPYVTTLLQSARRPGTAELSLSPIQMHSLRTFWVLLIPWPPGVWALYILRSLAVIGMAAASEVAFAARATFFRAHSCPVLVNPHIYIYDLLALVPVFLLLVDWISSDARKPFSVSLRLLLYLAFVVPLVGPFSHWTHLQLTVPAFAALLWTLWSYSRTSEAQSRMVSS